MQRSFRILLSGVMLGALIGAGFLGCGVTEPGTGTLNVYLAFDGSFEPVDGSSAPGLPGTGGSGSGLRGQTEVQSDLIPPKRTPLSDLIITIDEVAVWGCVAVMEDTMVVATLIFGGIPAVLFTITVVWTSLA